MPTKLIHRSNTLLPANATTATRPDFGIGYSVNALEPGGQVALASGGTTATLRKGHGLRAGSVVFKFSAGVVPSVVTVKASPAPTETTVELSAALTLVVGDLLVNMGIDDSMTGGTPDYDGGNLPIYSDMDGSTVLSGSLVVSDATGGYEYWYRGREVWELIRDTKGKPQAVEIYVGGQGAVVNVMDFGAVGDGVADDYRAIQNAIDSLLNGDTIYFPDGYKFLIGTGLVHDPDTIINYLSPAANSQGITYTGSGIIKATAAITCLTFRNCNRFTLRDLVFEGNNVDGSTGLYVQSSWSFNVVNCTVGNKVLGFESGIFLSGSYAALSGGGDGSAQHEIDISDCDINVKDVEDSVGIKCENADTFFHRNYVRGAQIGIDVASDGDDVVATENLIDGCHIYGWPSTTYPMLSGIAFKRATVGAPNSLKISRCHFGTSYVGHVCIDCEDASSISIEDNLFTVGENSQLDPCIKFVNTSLVGVSACVITGNHFDYSRPNIKGNMVAASRPINVDGLNSGEQDIWFNSDQFIIQNNSYEGVPHTGTTGSGWPATGGIRQESFTGASCELRMFEDTLDLAGVAAGGVKGTQFSILGAASDSFIQGAAFTVTEAFSGGSITSWDAGYNGQPEFFLAANTGLTLGATAVATNQHLIAIGLNGDAAHTNTFEGTGYTCDHATDGKLYITLNGTGTLVEGKVKVTVWRWVVTPAAN